MIFPDARPAEAAQGDLPLYQDWAVDFATGRLKTRGGRQYLVSGKEALAVWIWKALRTPRYRYPAYGPSYGQEFSRLWGWTDFAAIQGELKRLITEALLVSPYLLSVGDWAFQRQEDRVRARFRVATVYGDLEAETEAALS